MSAHFDYIERERFGGETDIVVCHTKVCGLQAQLAVQFMERWGMVAGEPNGEDSAGVADIVSRACEAAAQLYAEFEKREWLLTRPLPKNSTEGK
jgi:hypothetical protein